MNSRNALMGMTFCAAAMTLTGRAEAWQSPLGTYLGSCSVSYLAGGTTLFTLNSYGFANCNNGVYSYTSMFDLTNVSDPNGLTGFSVDASGDQVTGYFAGFAPPSALAVGSQYTALHDGNLVPVGQTFLTGTDGANMHKANASVSDSNGVVTFTDLTAPIAEGRSNGSQLTTGWSYSKTDMPGEELFIQSDCLPYAATVTVNDAAKNAFSVTTCGSDVCGPGLPGAPHGLPAAPEPGSMIPFALGGLGLLGLTARARRRAA